MNSDVTPSFGAWLQSTREEQGWTVSELAERAQLPRSTLATLESRARRGSRPRPDVILRISTAVHLPVLAVAVVAGYFERDVIDVGTDAVFDRIPIPSLHVDWWARSGGAYLRVVRESKGLSSVSAVQRWSAQWSALSLTAEEWDLLESNGVLPESWESIAHLKQIDRLPGAWLWGLVHAVSGDMVDLIGLAFGMARLRSVRCEKPWGAKSDYKQLARASNDERGAMRELNLEPYHSRVRDIGWTIPWIDAVERPNKSPRGNGPQSDPIADDLGRLVWDYLNRTIPGISEVGHDALLTAIVENWTTLSANAKQRIAELLEQETSGH